MQTDGRIKIYKYQYKFIFGLPNCDLSEIYEYHYLPNGCPDKVYHIFEKNSDIIVTEILYVNCAVKTFKEYKNIVSSIKYEMCLSDIVKNKDFILKKYLLDSKEYSKHGKINNLITNEKTKVYYYPSNVNYEIVDNINESRYIKIYSCNLSPISEIIIDKYGNVKYLSKYLLKHKNINPENKIYDYFKEKYDIDLKPKLYEFSRFFIYNDYNISVVYKEGGELKSVHIYGKYNKLIEEYVN